MSPYALMVGVWLCVCFSNIVLISIAWCVCVTVCDTDCVHACMSYLCCSLVYLSAKCKNWSNEREKRFKSKICTWVWNKQHVPLSLIQAYSRDYNIEVLEPDTQWKFHPKRLAKYVEHALVLNFLLWFLSVWVIGWWVWVWKRYTDAWKIVLLGGGGGGCNWSCCGKLLLFLYVKYYCKSYSFHMWNMHYRRMFYYYLLLWMMCPFVF